MKKSITLFLALAIAILISPASAQESRIIGTSVEGRSIIAKRIGRGADAVVLIGGIHGGYEWNTVILSKMVYHHFLEKPELIPEALSLYIIEVMNPDGLYKIIGETKIQEFDFSDVSTGRGRVNARGVDLNRNWDNNWKAEAYWGQFEVSGGDKPFSEPETRAVRDFLIPLRPAAVIFYHSAADGIYYGGSREGNPRGREIALAYSRESGYPLAGGGSSSGSGKTSLVNYRVTGAASGYLYSNGINSMAVELKNHQDPDFNENLKGLLSLFDLIARP